MSSYRQLTAVPPVLARILEGALQAEGIDVVLDRAALGAVYGLDSGEWATRVLVAADQLDRAPTLLDEFETADLG